MRKVLVLFIIITVFIVLGCNKNIFILPIKEDTSELYKFDNAEITYNKSNYPVNIINYNSSGEAEVSTYIKPPRRVIAIWQNSIETLLALGVGDRIIAGNGVPDKKYFLPEYQNAYKKIPFTGLQLLDLETTIMLQPDFIIGWNSTFAPNVIRSTDFWHKRNINTYISANSIPNKKYKTLANEYEDILNLGKIFDRNEQAKKIVDSMNKEIQFVINNVVDKDKKPRALVIEFLGKEVSVYNEKTLAGNIVKELHGDLLASRERSIGIEQIVDYDPDVIFVIVVESYYGHEEQVINKIIQHPALKKLHCVKNLRVIPLPLYEVYSSGVRTYDGIKDIAKGLYPEIYNRGK